jgi:hypothetical protein
MNRVRFTAVFVFLVVAQLFAAEKSFQPGTIVDVQQKTNTRVLYYIVNTPVTKDEPYYEVSVQVKDMLYTGRYAPRHAEDTLLEEWKPGSAVEARIEGRQLLLKRVSGAGMQLAIIKREAVKTGQGSSEAIPARK